MNYDVVIVGGGPGGAIAARECAQSGLKTLLLEKKELKREKACAGGLTKKVLDRFDIPKDVIERYYYGWGLGLEDDFVTLDDREKIGALVCRGKFDSKLVNIASDAGAEVREKTKVLDLIMKNDFVTGVQIKSDNQTHQINSNIVIGADGHSSVVRKKLGAFVQNPGRISLWYQYHMALSKELIDERIGNRIEMYFGEDISRTEYAWIFPKRNIVTVGIGGLVSEVKGDRVRLKERLDKFVNNHPIAKKKLEGAKPIMGQGCRIACPGSSTSTHFNGALLIGEAAGHAMLSSGEGIYYAMVGGEIGSKWAVNAVSCGDLSKEFLTGYENEWKKEIGRDLDRSVKIHEAFGGFQTLTKEVINMIKKNPKMKQSILDSLLKGTWGLL